jgi:ATP-dependent DNA helicase RecG
MPSALETLVKILKLEQETGFKNTAVIGGLQAYVPNWSRDAHREAKTDQQHALVEELSRVMEHYQNEVGQYERQQTIKYMLGRITGREEPRDEFSVELTPEVRKEIKDIKRKDEPAASTAPRIKTQVDLLESAIEVEQVFQSPRPKAPKPRRQPRKNLSLDELQEILDGLNEPVTTLRGVGEKRAEQLASLGIQTVNDLVFYFPRRYDDYTRMQTLRHLRPDQLVTVAGTVREVTERYGNSRRQYVRVRLDDGSASVTLMFFNQPYLKRMLRPGMQITVAGKTELFNGKISIANPEWEPVDQQNLHREGIVPIYSLTKGISAKAMRKLTRQAIEQWAGRVPDYMPESVLDRTEMVDLGWAIRQLHFPRKFDYIDYAQERLAFDELMLMQLGVLTNRREWQAVPGVSLPTDDEWLHSFTDTLPYALTGAQQRAIAAIRADMAKDVPMNRLLQGDVGAGKTVVAALTLGIALEHGTQGAIMAPTSVLAEQHYQSMQNVFANIPGAEEINIQLLTGATPASERESIYSGLADGSVDIIVGTHALIQENVEFHNLTVAIIDEQHRFGVNERGMLRGKGTNPHVLVMTATPIPRTLALTMFADLDLTVLDEMPPGRQPIETMLLFPGERERVYGFIRSQLDAGRQAFMVYPLVEESDKLDATAAIEAYEDLTTTSLANYRVGLLHGRLSPREKDEIMEAFSAHELDVLISTTVIEVGIDVPNASVMYIDGADRFGLAQLHQLRGRVGRGQHKSYCLLVTDSKKQEAVERLKKLETVTDGFALAELDWSTRGPGELLGKRQSGFTGLQMTTQMRPHLVELAQQEARAIYAEDPYFESDKHTLLAQRLAQLHQDRTDIS